MTADTTTAPELLPCPFCGEPPFSYHPSGGHAASCDECGIEMLATSWNRRAPVAQDGQPVAWLWLSKDGRIVRSASKNRPERSHLDQANADGDSIIPVYAHPTPAPQNDEAATLRDHLTRAKSAADDALAKAKADQADEGIRIKLKMTAHTIGLLLEEDIQ